MIHITRWLELLPVKSRALIGVFAGHYFLVTPVCSITDRQIEHMNHEVVQFFAFSEYVGYVWLKAKR